MCPGISLRSFLDNGLLPIEIVLINSLSYPSDMAVYFHRQGGFFSVSVYIPIYQPPDYARIDTKKIAEDGAREEGRRFECILWGTRFLEMLNDSR